MHAYISAVTIQIVLTFVLYTADCTIQQIALNKTTQTISLKSFFFCLVFSSFVALLRPDLRVVNGKVYNACKLYLWLVIYLLLTKQKFCLHSIFIFLAVNSSLRLAPRHNMPFGRSPSFFVSAKGLCVAISSFRQWVIWTNLGQGERTTTLYNSFGFMIISLI